MSRKTIELEAMNGVDMKKYLDMYRERSQIASQERKESQQSKKSSIDKRIR